MKTNPLNYSQAFPETPNNLKRKEPDTQSEQKSAKVAKIANLTTENLKQFDTDSDTSIRTSSWAREVSSFSPVAMLESQVVDLSRKNVRANGTIERLRSERDSSDSTAKRLRSERNAALGKIKELEERLFSLEQEVTDLCNYNLALSDLYQDKARKMQEVLNTGFKVLNGEL